MKIILIEDNPVDGEHFKQLIRQFTSVEIVSEFLNFSDAFSWLKTNTVDAIFSDIELPDMNAIEGFKSLNISIPIILVSSHPEFAVSGYDINPIHFLTKPIQPAKLLQAIDRAQGTVQTKGEFCFVLSNGNYKKIHLNSIMYIKANENYAEIYLSGGVKKTVLSNLTQLLRQLDNRFYRVHKGYAVNLDEIEAFENEHVIIEGVIIPIGNGYKNAFMERMNKYVIKRQKN